MVAREIVDDLVRAKGVPCKNDMLIAAPLTLVEIGGDIFVSLGEALVPRADYFLILRDGVPRPDDAERIARLCVYEVDPGGVQRVSDIVLERIGIEVPVYARDRDHESVRPPRREKQRPVQHRPPPGGDIEFVHFSYFMSCVMSAMICAALLISWMKLMACPTET